VSLIDDLRPVVDAARQTIQDVGYRIHDVRLLKITWPVGGVGIGNPTSRQETILTPRPKVLKYTMEQIIKSGGSVTEADLNISKISKSYSLAQLSGGDLADNIEFFWIVDGVLYNFIGYQERPLGWNVQVRKTNRNA
jgi:hypothetical protein